MSKTKAVKTETTEDTKPEIEIVDNMVLTPRPSRCKYPFEKLDVGAGFKVTGAKNPSSVYAAAKRCGVKVSTRVTPEGLEVLIIKK